MGKKMLMEFSKKKTSMNVSYKINFPKKEKQIQSRRILLVNILNLIKLVWNLKKNNCNGNSVKISHVWIQFYFMKPFGMF